MAVNTRKSKPKRVRRRVAGAALIAAERRRQVSEEGYDATHDDSHTDGALAKAAVCYASPTLVYEMRGASGSVCFIDPWPFSRSDDARPTDVSDQLVPNILASPEERVDLLVKAGALIAAEIDRLQRAFVAVERYRRAVKRARPR